MHESKNYPDTKNGALTPEAVEEALENLPYDYVKRTKKLLDKKNEAGEIDRTYKERWIISVRKGESFNEDVLNALVEVGQDYLKRKSLFGKATKKTPSAA